MSTLPISLTAIFNDKHSVPFLNLILDGVVSHFRHRFFINQFTSSASLGFRIEGYSQYRDDKCVSIYKGSDVKPRARTEAGNVREFKLFFKDRHHLVKKVIKKLRKLEKSLQESEWFWHHELVCRFYGCS